MYHFEKKLRPRWHKLNIFVLCCFAAGLNIDPMRCRAASAVAVRENNERLFSETAREVLQRHCFECHSHDTGKARGGLMLDRWPSVLAGGDSGPAMVAGEIDKSRLLQAIRYDLEDLQMPPEGPISAVEIAQLEQWVQRSQPEKLKAKAVWAEPRETFRRQVLDHWAFQPLQNPPLPAPPLPGSKKNSGVKTDAISQDDSVKADSVGQQIDAWLALARQKPGLAATETANPRSLVRRLYIDLWGLPPTPEQMVAYLEDDRQDKWELLVEQLLAAPQFGERWGRHWLDLARYADSNGCSIESNNTYDDAWRYRDYVIESHYHDKPYDQFVLEQIAGDLLPAVSDPQRAEHLIATGFLLLGPKAFGTSGFEAFRLDVIDEQIDTVGKVFLGLSLGCARCHDHKFDPVPASEYYALAGVFSSTASVHTEKGWRQGRTWNRVPLPFLDDTTAGQLQDAYEELVESVKSGEHKKEAESAVKDARQQVEALRQDTAAVPDALAAAEANLSKAERALRNTGKMAKVLPIVNPVPTAMAVRDQAKVVNEAIRIRGTADRKGDIVPRGIPTLMGDPACYPIAADASGRLELARWLVDVEHGAGSLTARVAVNRIWNHMLGRPLVASADNFGLSGSVPDHPELLEYLASSLVSHHWSVKRMVRAIACSATYRRSSTSLGHEQEVDPDNRTYWRHAPRRLDAETLRDGILLISNQLDHTRGGKTLQHLGLLTIGSDHLELDTPSPYHRRTVYVPILRDALDIDAGSDETNHLLSTFDFADPNLVRATRNVTVVPGQPLWLLNSDFIYRASEQLAKNLLSDSQRTSDQQRYHDLSELIYGRPPTAEEFSRAERMLSDFAGNPAGNQTPAALDPRVARWTSLCQLMLGSVEFLFVQ